MLVETNCIEVKLFKTNFEFLNLNEYQLPTINIFRTWSKLENSFNLDKNKALYLRFQKRQPNNNQNEKIHRWIFFGILRFMHQNLKNTAGFYRDRRVFYRNTRKCRLFRLITPKKRKGSLQSFNKFPRISRKKHYLNDYF